MVRKKAYHTTSIFESAGRQNFHTLHLEKCQIGVTSKLNRKLLLWLKKNLIHVCILHLNLLMLFLNQLYEQLKKQPSGMDCCSHSLLEMYSILLQYFANDSDILSIVYNHSVTYAIKL